MGVGESRNYGPLRGRVAAPGDKSVSHRAALLPLIATDVCRARDWLDSADTRASLEAVRALGVHAEFSSGSLMLSPPTDIVVVSGNTPLEIDCGNSGTTARLLCGLLAGWLAPGGPGVILRGDDSLSTRPMARIVDPLREMGADIQLLADGATLPLLVRGARLRGGDFELPVASAQVKSALLLAGLASQAAVTVRGAGGSRDHTERLLQTMGVPVIADPAGDVVCLPGLHRAQGFDVAVPGDPSSAAFLQVAAALVPGSSVTVEGLSLNRGRTGALEVMRRAGVHVSIEPGAEADEPIGDVTVEPGLLRAFTVEPDEVPRLVDELPALAVLATQCQGVTVVRGAADLRNKESDRIEAVGSQLRAMGAAVEDTPDGWTITGPTPLRGGTPGAALRLATRGDHRIAMALTVADLVAEGETKLDDPDCVAVSYPEFFNVLDALRAR